MPGFVIVKCLNEDNRGGVAVLLKTKLKDQIFAVDRMYDQVWFSLRFFPNFRFGACYVPPKDSLYFSPRSFSDIQNQIISSDQNFIIIGDFNARMGNLAIQFDNERYQNSYADNCDNGSNAHGRTLKDMCGNLNLCPLNHLRTPTKTFDGNFTYKQGATWISQIDWVLISEKSVQFVNNFNIIQQLPIKTDHAAVSLSVTQTFLDTQRVLDRATLLGTYQESQRIFSERAVPYHNVNKGYFLQNCPDPELIWQNIPENVECLSLQISEMLYDICKSAKFPIHALQMGTVENAQKRWQKLLELKDPRIIWKSIGWKGDIDSLDQKNVRPSDRAFCAHFENLLNPTDNTVEITIPTSQMYVPILDDPISPSEVEYEIKKLKAGKAAGHDGIPPGILKWLSDEWIILLTYLFNQVFCNSYPMNWALSKMFTIYKKGPVQDTNNYRGISILVALAKVYDSILCRRFSLWYQPAPEQAGSQKGKSCIEQILTLRLLIDYAKHKKVPLYIAFIDYVKAYDRVDRNKLLQLLCQKGVGNRFLQALGCSLQRTRSVIGLETFDYINGVKQGGPTSGVLFTFYVNCTIESLKTFGVDGYLQNWHSLLFMDDTIVLATSRESLMQKLQILLESAKSINMKVHPTKSQYMTIAMEDIEPIQIQDCTLKMTKEYIYLGANISCLPLSEQVANHIRRSQIHLHKFVAFIAKNSTAPYKVKKLVWDSALKGAILYACESWMCENLKVCSAIYMSSLKMMLGVRTQTCTDLVLVEAQTGSSKAYIKKRQISYLKKIALRSDFQETPLYFALTLAKAARTPMGKYVTFIETEDDPVLTELQSIKNRIITSDSSRRQAYAKLNNDLSLHKAYKSNTIPEHARKAFTRLRLGSHRLKMETGRWARLPPEQRLCECGQIQTDEHILCHCTFVVNLRRKYTNVNFDSIENVMNSPCYDLTKFCYELLSLFESL